MCAAIYLLILQLNICYKFHLVHQNFLITINKIRLWRIIQVDDS
ncbi:MAG: hypothetical protein JWR50_3410 [Mucilaginibacter sp.]|nr:hypothetical protein [Mucilaginibacter sp.]